MAGTRKAPLWLQAFLRALRRLGNVRAAAFEAGVDPGTAYDHRAKDAAFRAKWAGALKACGAAQAKARARGPLHHPAGGPPPRAGEELVVRRTKDGDKLVRAAAGRWSRRVEESFLDALEHTGCVRHAAASVGMSTNALYQRRARYPEFAARWDERAARAGTQLPGVLNAAALESLAPEVPGAKRRGRARLPAIDVDQAIRIKVANDNAEAKARGPRRRGGISSREREEKQRAELEEALVKLLGMLKRRRAAQRLAEGWTELGDGVWLPPGWTATPPDETRPAPRGLLPPPDSGADGAAG